MEHLQWLLLSISSKWVSHYGAIKVIMVQLNPNKKAKKNISWYLNLYLKI